MGGCGWRNGLAAAAAFACVSCFGQIEEMDKGNVATEECVAKALAYRRRGKLGTAVVYAREASSRLVDEVGNEPTLAQPLATCAAIEAAAGNFDVAAKQYLLLLEADDSSHFFQERERLALLCNKAFCEWQSGNIDAAGQFYESDQFKLVSLKCSQNMRLIQELTYVRYLICTGKTGEAGERLSNLAGRIPEKHTAFHLLVRAELFVATDKLSDARDCLIATLRVYENDVPHLKKLQSMQLLLDVYKRLGNESESKFLAAKVEELRSECFSLTPDDDVVVNPPD